MKTFIFKINFPLILIFLVCFPAVVPISQGATLTWNVNTEVDLAGYKVYYGDSLGNYKSVVDVGNVTEYKLRSLKEEVIYYIAMTAYDNSGNESTFSTELDYFMEDGIPGDYDNCPQTPNGPDGGTCICGGEPCMSDFDCECGSCSMNQEDTNSDGLGDVCDEILCQAYLCRYEYCINLHNTGRNLDPVECMGYGDESSCEAAECYWNPQGLTNGACTIDICLNDTDFTGEIDGTDLTPFKKQMGRVDCLCNPSGDLCQKYSDLYNCCVDLSNAGRNLDHTECMGYGDESSCEAAECYWNPQGLPNGACTIDICLGDSDFTGEVDGSDLTLFKKELGRVDCLCQP